MTKAAGIFFLKNKRLKTACNFFIIITSCLYKNQTSYVLILILKHFRSHMLNTVSKNLICDKLIWDADCLDALVLAITGQVIFNLGKHQIISTAWKFSKYGDFSGPYFPAFVNLCIQSKYRKIRTRKTPYLDTFQTMIKTAIAATASLTVK